MVQNMLWLALFFFYLLGLSSVSYTHLTLPTIA